MHGVLLQDKDAEWRCGSDFGRMPKNGKLRISTLNTLTHPQTEKNRKNEKNENPNRRSSSHLTLLSTVQNVENTLQMYCLLHTLWFSHSGTRTFGLFPITFITLLSGLSAWAYSCSISLDNFFT